MKKKNIKLIASTVRLKPTLHEKIKGYLVGKKDYDDEYLTLGSLHEYMYEMFMDDKTLQEKLKKQIKQRAESLKNNAFLTKNQKQEPGNGDSEQ